MATEQQIRANRRNALKSTGPRTVEGKLITRRNATRHGFYASAVLLAEEDRNDYVRLARGAVGFYSPQSVLEEEQVLIIIQTLWQLRRANIVDAELFQMYQVCDGQRGGVGTAFAQDATQGNSFTKLTRYQSFLLRKLEFARKELAVLKSERRAKEASAAISAQESSAQLMAAPRKAILIASPLVMQATPLLENV